MNNLKTGIPLHAMGIPQYGNAGLPANDLFTLCFDILEHEMRTNTRSEIKSGQVFFVQEAVG